MTPRWLSGDWPDYLIAAARFEYDRRADAYPKAVADGRMTAADAQADFAAWFGIRAWMAGQPGIAFDFAAMDWAAAKAIASLDALVAKDPQDGDVQLRRARVYAIAHGVSSMRAWLDETNQGLRDAAASRAHGKAAA